MSNLKCVRLLDHHVDEYDGVQFLHFTCVLFKLGIIEEPISVNRKDSPYDMVKLATDYIAGHPHIFERYR